MSSLPQPSPRVTETAYLAVERAAEFRSEFFDGEMFAMAGETPEHSLIAANLVGELRSLLRRPECTAYAADLRIKVGKPA